jgi:hypothetical protein
MLVPKLRVARATDDIEALILACPIRVVRWIR